MRRHITSRSLVVLVALGALAATSGCFCLPGGTPPPSCVSATTVELGVPFTVCLPEAGSRVSVTLDFGGSIAALITCSDDALVKTEAADNYSCGSWNTNDVATRTILPGAGNVEFGVNPYTGDPVGTPPGEITVTITAESA